jgi:hypothetical protein
VETELLEPAIGRKDSELLYTYWQDGAFFVGFLNDYPEDSTQGISLTELEEALIEIYDVKQEEKRRIKKKSIY